MNIARQEYEEKVRVRITQEVPDKPEVIANMVKNMAMFLDAARYHEFIPAHMNVDHMYEIVKQFSLAPNQLKQCGAIMIVGGPGAGKSTIGNVFVHKDSAKFDVHHGAESKDLVFERQPTHIPSWAVVDTPGLFDVRDDNVDKVKAAITFHLPGLFKFCFTIEPRGGRLDIEDVDVIKAVVLGFAPGQRIHYVVVVNGWNFETPLDRKTRFTDLLTKHLIEKKPIVHPPCYIVYIPHVSGLKDNANYLQACANLTKVTTVFFLFHKILF